MPIRLDSRAGDFAARFESFLAAKRETAADVDEAVRAIVAAVAPAAMPRWWNSPKNSTGSILPQRPCASRRPRSTTPTRPAPGGARRARLRARAHRGLSPPPAAGDDRFTDALGVELGSRWTAIEAVGLYVPGGTAAYPSSVLMNAVPAKVAGVPRLVMVVPAPGRRAQSAGAGGGETCRRRRDLPRRRRPGGGGARLRHRDHRAGRQDRRPRQCLCRGRQAPCVRQGRHRHDRRALRGADPRRRATPMPTGSPPIFWPRPSTTPAAQSILITDDAALADDGRARRRSASSRRCRARTSRAASWRDFGAIILVRELADARAAGRPHRARASRDRRRATPRRWPARIRNAGAIFIGAHTPEAIGDYVAGSNHVLPTARSARFSSGLGVLDFMKRTSILKCGPEQLARARAGRDRARRGGGARRPCPLGRHPAQPAMTPAGPMDKTRRLVKVCARRSLASGRRQRATSSTSARSRSTT